MLEAILNLTILPFRGFVLINYMCAIVTVTAVFRIVWILVSRPSK